VGEIQNKVSSADDIDVLKEGISIHLKKIREEVEENDLVEKEKEKMSAESYANITGELSSTQEELAELKEQLEETKSQLLHDSLTGLYNRLAYEDRVEVEFSRSRRIKSPLCLAMWDIDYFKKVNDNYGHDVGDRVLKAFSDVIMKRIRKTDMFARIGGEEFVLLMPDTSSDVALTLNNELRETFMKCKFSYEDTTFSATSSVGIADFTEGDTPESVLKKADLALYASKDTGRNCCTVFKENEVQVS
jgi:diguanylate cyclase